MSVNHPILIAVIAVFCSACSGDNPYQTDSMIHKDEVSACDFSQVVELDKFSFSMLDTLSSHNLTPISPKQSAFLFDQSKHPSPQESYFLGKFELGERTGIISYSKYRNAMGQQKFFYQLHILKACENVFSDYLAMEDSEVMIYEVSSVLSKDYKELKITRRHSAYSLVGESDLMSDTLYTKTFLVNLSAKKVIKEHINTEVAIINY